MTRTDRAAALYRAIHRRLDAARARFAPQIATFEAIREHEAGRLLLAGVVVGAIGAFAAVMFDGLMGTVGELVLGTAFPARTAPIWWRALLGPPVAGLAVGLLVRHLTHRGRPQGMADVLARVQLDEPSLSFRDGTVSALTAALAVGSGFSGGREGPIIQFASTLAMWACRLMRVRPASLRTLVAAGAAAGIAASFNTPLGRADGFETLPDGATLPEIVATFLRRRVEAVHLVDPQGHYQGTILLQDVKSAFAAPETAEQARPRRVATALVTESLAAVLPRFFDAPGDSLPVVDLEGRLVGVLAERDVVAAYHRGVLTKDARLAHVVRREGDVEHDDYLELPQGQVMEGVLVGAARAGKTLRDLRLPQAYGCTVVAMSIWDEGLGDWERRPVDADRALRPEDKLIVIGPSDAVVQLEAAGAEPPG